MATRVQIPYAVLVEAASHTGGRLAPFVPSPAATPMTRRHLLLVDPDAAAADALAGIPGLDVSVARSVVAARAYLGGSAFDAVAVQADLDPDDTLGALAAGLSVPGGVVRYADVTALLSRFGATPTASVAPVLAEPVRPTVDVSALHDALADLRAEIGRVAHDLANPLAVIAGNAQLGAELVRGADPDGMLTQAFTDIGEAAAELERRVSDLGALRRRVDALTATGPRSE